MADNNDRKQKLRERAEYELEGLLKGDYGVKSITQKLMELLTDLEERCGEGLIGEATLIQIESETKKLVETIAAARKYKDRLAVLNYLDKEG